MVLALCVGLPWASHAQPSDGALQAWTQQTHVWLQQQMAEADTQGQLLRPTIEVGQLDRRLQLAPCQQVEPYLPTGTRLWGRTRVGLRCVDGVASWNVFLPITVRAWGPAWVVRQPVAAGQPLTANDLEATEVDWAEGVTPVVFRQTDWLGQAAARPLVPGQVLRRGMVRAPQVFTAGSQVRVVVRGDGFQLTASGSALTHGHLGQPARIRMPNRKVLTGTVLNADTVEIAL